MQTEQEEEQNVRAAAAGHVVTTRPLGRHDAAVGTSARGFIEEIGVSSLLLEVLAVVLSAGCIVGEMCDGMEVAVLLPARVTSHDRMRRIATLSVGALGAIAARDIFTVGLEVCVLAEELIAHHTLHLVVGQSALTARDRAPQRRHVPVLDAKLERLLVARLQNTSSSQ